jgi:hypothetical protein
MPIQQQFLPTTADQLQAIIHQPTPPVPRNILNAVNDGPTTVVSVNTPTIYWGGVSKRYLKWRYSYDGQPCNTNFNRSIGIDADGFNFAPNTPSGTYTVPMNYAKLVPAHRAIPLQPQL